MRCYVLLLIHLRAIYRHHAPLPLNVKQTSLKKDVFLCDHCKMIISETITLTYYEVHKFKFCYLLIKMFFIDARLIL